MDAEDKACRYSMILEWDPRDNIYIVTVPELPGCRTHGSTREEAVRMGEEVIELWLEGEKSAPPPRTFTYWSNLGHIVLTPIEVGAPQSTPIESRSA